MDGFEGLYQQLNRHITLAGKSESTITNYARCLARMALQTKANPITLDLDQVLDYLLHCKNQHKTPSDSFFKHTVLI